MRCLWAVWLASGLLAGCGLPWAAAPADPPVATVSESLDHIVTNLSVPGQFVQVSLSVQLRAAPHGTAGSLAAQWKGDSARIRATVLQVLRGQSPASLAGSRGLDALESTLTAALRRVDPATWRVYVVSLVVS